MDHVEKLFKKINDICDIGRDRPDSNLEYIEAPLRVEPIEETVVKNLVVILDDLDRLFCTFPRGDLSFNGVGLAEEVVRVINEAAAK